MIVYLAKNVKVPEAGKRRTINLSRRHRDTEEIKDAE